MKKNSSQFTWNLNRLAWIVLSGIYLILLARCAQPRSSLPEMLSRNASPYLSGHFQVWKDSGFAEIGSPLYLSDSVVILWTALSDPDLDSLSTGAV